MANPIDLGSTVKSVMDSVSEMKAANVNINVVVVTGSDTTYEFLVGLDMFISNIRDEHFNF
jgi:hypothetical protein